MYLAHSTNWGDTSQVELSNSQVEKCWFMRRGKNRSTGWRKASRSKDENQQQTQPTSDDSETGNRTRATLVGGECSHHYAIPAPPPPPPPKKMSRHSQNISFWRMRYYSVMTQANSEKEIPSAPIRSRT